MDKSLEVRTQTKSTEKELVKFLKRTQNGAFTKIDLKSYSRIPYERLENLKEEEYYYSIR